MYKSPSQIFQAQFPGPFHYSRGVDGVDDTYDIYCNTTGRYVISNYFWVDSPALELEIRLICTALNTLVGKCEPPAIMSHERDRAMYLSHRPGPFLASPCECNMRGSGWDVVCLTTKQSVIASYASEHSARILSQAIATALGLLCQ